MSQAPALGTVVYKSGFKNKIINGGMDIAQRGTSFATVASGTYTLDRWQWQQSGAGIGTITQQADAPSDNEFQSSLRYAVTTADTSIAATDIYYLRHAIEGYNARDLIGRTFTLSFRVRSSKTGTHCAAFQNSASDRAFLAEYTVVAANTWEKKTIQVPAGLITAGTWNWTNGIGVVVDFVLAAGSNFQSTAGSWLSSSALATSNQVNCMDTVGNIFAITGVQLEVGGSASQFEHRAYGQELALCQRYYQMLGNTVNNEFNAYCYVASAGASMLATYSLMCEMRAAPNVTKVGTWTISNASAQPFVSTASKQRFVMGTYATAAGMVQFNNSTAASMYVTADAEL